MLSHLKTRGWWEVWVGMGIAVGCLVFMLANTGCAETQGAIISPTVLSDAQRACRHVKAGHMLPPDAEACSKAVMRSYKHAVGTWRLMCWVDMQGVSCVPRYHVDRWQVHAYIVDHGRGWHIRGVSYPKTGTFEKAPLSGAIT